MEMGKDAFNARSGAQIRIDKLLGREPPFGLLMGETTREQLTPILADALADFSKGDSTLIINMSEIPQDLQDEYKKASENITITSALSRRITAEAFSQIRALLPDEIEPRFLQSIYMQMTALETAPYLAEENVHSRAIYDDNGKYSFGIVATAEKDYASYVLGVSGIDEKYFDSKKLFFSPQADQFFEALHEISHNKLRSKLPEELSVELGKTISALEKTDGSSINSQSLYEEINADRKAMQYYLDNAKRLGLEPGFVKGFEQLRALAAFHQNINYTDRIAFTAAGMEIPMPAHVVSNGYDIAGNKVIADKVSLDLPKMTDAVLTGNQLADSLVGKEFFEAYKKYESQFYKPEIVSSLSDLDVETESDPEGMVKKYGPLAEVFHEFAAIHTEGFKPMTDFDYATLGATITATHPDIKYGAIKKLNDDGVIAQYSEHLDNPQLANFVEEYLEAGRNIAPALAKSDLSKQMQNSKQSIPGPASFETYLSNNNIELESAAQAVIVSPTPEPLPMPSPAP